MPDVGGLDHDGGRGCQDKADAKQNSCQLSTYFVGRTAFYRLRQEVQRELGAKFELGRYHEAVLDHGTLPVKYLPELVRERLGRAVWLQSAREVTLAGRLPLLYFELLNNAVQFRWSRRIITSPIGNPAHLAV